ncbi:MAG: hypothetical protein M3342_06515, partial [Bacteroidota bacterium]|nr:hypothetical protein [Bacteroidota bacterium]
LRATLFRFVGRTLQYSNLLLQDSATELFRAIWNPRGIIDPLYVSNCRSIYIDELSKLLLT